MEGAPEMIGRYKVLSELGRGGMSVVYQGFDTQLERHVAIKVLHAHLAGDPQSRLRFHSEARAVARLRHPNIIEVYDFSDASNGTSFLVTEYVKGETLRQFAEKHNLFFPEVGALLTWTICRAVAHAHQEGIIHRDLKPENVMVSESGALKLMDFGVAKLIDQKQQLTLTGSLLGSPAHMSPESLEGGQIGFASDVFSIGTIMYWLMTGKLPFFGNTPHQVIRAIVEGRYPDPLQANPAMGSRLAALVRRTLEREVAKRIPSAAALAEELGRLLAESGIAAGDEWLKKILLEPHAALKEIKAVTVLSQFERGSRQLEQGATAQALECFDRVLNIEPDHQGALQAIQAVRRRSKRRFWLAASGAALAAAAAAAFVWLALQWRAPEKVEPPQLPQENTEGNFTPPSPAPPEAQAGEASLPAGEAKTAPERKAEPKAKKVQPKLAAEPITASPAMHQVEIVVEPYFGSISIDNKLVASANERETGYGHFYRANLTEGEHRVVIEHPAAGQDSFVLKVPTSGQVRRKLKFLPAQIFIDSDQPQASLFLDGEFRGKAAAAGLEPVVVTMEDAPEREVHLRLVDESGRSWEEKIRLRAGEKKRLRANLGQAPQAGGK